MRTPPLVYVGAFAVTSLLVAERATADIPMDDGAPPGAVAFFVSAKAICPEGWIRASAAAGRLVVGVTDGKDVGAVVGDPLADQEDRKHGHDVKAQIVVPFKSISAADGGNGSGAAAKAYDLAVATNMATSGLPFVQLLACVKQ